MRDIIPGIKTLIQHIQQWRSDPERYCPERCRRCGYAGQHHHGTYPRKADRENAGDHNLNPVLIPRFYCPHCHHTCSVLPECIPPRRWYLWSIQQAALLWVLQGGSFSQAARTHQPSRRTIRRWVQRLAEHFELHAFHLRSQLAQLGRFEQLKDFWSACFDHFSLAQAMYLLNQSGVLIP